MHPYSGKIKNDNMRFFIFTSEMVSLISFQRIIRLVDSNGILIYLRLFYVKRLTNSIHYTFILTFFVLLFLTIFVLHMILANFILSSFTHQALWMYRNCNEHERGVCLPCYEALLVSTLVNVGTFLTRFFFYFFFFTDSTQPCHTISH